MFQLLYFAKTIERLKTIRSISSLALFGGPRSFLPLAYNSYAV